VDVSEQQMTRLLCKDGVDTDTVRKLAAQHWFLWNRIDRDDNQPLVYEWSTAAKDCRIRYIDDHRLGLRWFDVFGARTDETISLIARSVPLHDRGEIIALASSAKTEPESIWAAFKLAVFAPLSAFDAELFGAFGDIANHASARVRHSIIYAMEQTRWREFAGILEPMAEDDPDESVRARAAQALKTIAT
jgi:sugar/nucleoside kinase (ribokinase family)